MKKWHVFLFLFCIATFGCLAQYPTDSIIPNPPGYSLSLLRPVNAFALDTSDNKWVGFGKIGLGKLNSTGWTIYDTSNSPLPLTILSLACNTSGVWVGTNSGLYN